MTSVVFRETRLSLTAIINSLFTKQYHVPKAKYLSGVIRSLSPLETVFFGLCGFLVLLSTLLVLERINTMLLVEIPTHGGTLEEGVVGSPRFVNPLLAIGDADRDLTMLIYSGLMRAEPDGALVPDLAQSYTISEDGRTYTFTLRNDATFHDGTKVTADDVLFTIAKAQDAALKSPKRANWDGVTVIKNTEQQIVFMLEQPYSPFLENTTLGILPKHLWKDIDIEEFPFSAYNTHAVGSGPFRVKKINRDSSGIPESYTLVPFKNFVHGAPYIDKLVVKFYPTEEMLLEAYRHSKIDSINSVTPESAQKLKEQGNRVLFSPLPRIFAVFFNQNQAQIFTHEEVRRALALAIDKEKIITDVLSGYGVPIDGPIPSDLLETSAARREQVKVTPEATTPEENATTTPAEDPRITKARKVLLDNGWKFDDTLGIMVKKSGKGNAVLSFSLATSNAPELKATAQIIKEAWEKLGGSVELKIFETGDLNQNVIRPRKFDALLFGEVVGRDLDLYAFWHSSQMSDPGLNIALYANITSDKLLEGVRATSDKNERMKKYHAFLDEIKFDQPAIFLYSPDFVYLIPEKIHGVKLGKITAPSERFLGIDTWYIETEHVWQIFHNEVTQSQ